MDTVPLQPIKSSMNRASDETRRLVEEDDRRAVGRTSNDLFNEDADGEDEYLKGKPSTRQTVRS